MGDAMATGDGSLDEAGHAREKPLQELRRIFTLLSMLASCRPEELLPHVVLIADTAFSTNVQV
jgi:hypothetical protein